MRSSARRTLAGAGVALLAACSSVTVIDDSAPAIAASDCRVTVHQTYNQAIQRGPIEELCVIDGTSSGSFSHTVATAIKKHKDKACACGARDVYIQSQTRSGLDVATVTLVAFRYRNPQSQ